MTQEAIQLPTTPPLSGADLVDNANAALLTIASGFSGAIDPAGIPGVGPYFIWNDTGNMLRKMRNAANTAWVTIGPLLENTSLGRLINIQVFDTVGAFTYTKTSGTNFIIGECQGAGGAGGGLPATGAGQNGAAQGGASGAYAVGIFYSGFDGALITVPAGGAPSAGLSGGTGATASIGSLLSAPGGPGGGGGASFVVAGFPTLSGPSAQSSAPVGGNLIAKVGQHGGHPIWIALQRPLSGTGGDSPLGAGGQARLATTANGAAGTGYGSGGGGGCLLQSSGINVTGGIGAQGIVIIREYA